MLIRRASRRIGLSIPSGLCTNLVETFHQDGKKRSVYKRTPSLRLATPIILRALDLAPSVNTRDSAARQRDAFRSESMEEKRRPVGRRPFFPPSLSTFDPRLSRPSSGSNFSQMRPLASSLNNKRSRLGKKRAGQTFMEAVTDALSFARRLGHAPRLSEKSKGTCRGSASFDDPRHPYSASGFSCSSYPVGDV